MKLRSIKIHLISQNRYSSIRYNTLTLSGGQTVMINKIIKHPRYDATSHENDIAMIKTDTPMTLGQINANKIKLPLLGSKPIPGTKLNMTGFGFYQHGLSEMSPNLKIAELKVISTEMCRRKNPKVRKTKMFCAESDDPEIFSGRGDQGGPGASNNVLLGILISWVYGDSLPNYDVFTEVSQFVIWIRTIMRFN